MDLANVGGRQKIAEGWGRQEMLILSSLLNGNVARDTVGVNVLDLILARVSKCSRLEIGAAALELAQELDERVSMSSKLDERVRHRPDCGMVL